MPSALVTGASGLVGSHIVEELLARGWNVRGLARSESSLSTVRKLGAEPVSGDILDAASLAAATRGVDTIFHTAAVITGRGGWESYRRMNLDGTTTVIDAAATAGARLLHLSSVAVYGATGRYATGKKTDEDTPLGPLPERSFYAR